MGLKIKGLLLGALMMTGVTGFAQEGTSLSNDGYDGGFRIGFGLNGSAATGEYYNWGLGGDVRLQYDLNRRYSLTLTTGFTHLFAEEEAGEDFQGLSYIPAKLGFKAFVWEDSFYVLGEAGAAFAVSEGVHETSFIWAPGIGYANKNFDLSVRYEGMNDFKTDQIALRLAYGFKI